MIYPSKTLSLQTGRVWLAIVALFLVVWSDAAQAQDGYRLRSGDILRIEVLEDPTLNRSALVAPDGRISMPLAGNVRASGQTLEAVQAALQARLAPNFAAPPTVFVALERQPEPRVRQEAAPVRLNVFVVGEARNPGRIEVAPGTTLLQAFGQMGGFTNFAATKRVQLRRGSDQWVIDYRAIEAGHSTAGNIPLADGDVIIVPQRGLFE